MNFAKKTKEGKEMKAMVSLAILVAALLLVTNMVFADCVKELCYEITSTDEYGNTDYDYWFACLKDDGIGWLYSDNADRWYKLYLFAGGPGGYLTEQGPPLVEWPTWIAKDKDGDNVGHIWTNAYYSNLIAAGERYGTRYTVKGHQVPCEEKVD